MQPLEFRIEQLFGSKTRARLLGLFLQHSKQAFFVRELTRRIDAQLNSVRRELKNLVELGLVVEKTEEGIVKKQTSLADKKKFYTANTDFILFEDLRSLFKKIQLFLKNSLVQEIQEKGDVAYFAFTGRFVDRDDVPTDMLIVGDIEPKALASVMGAFEHEMGYEVNYTLMSRNEFAYRRQLADRFLTTILSGAKIEMINKLGL